MVVGVELVGDAEFFAELRGALGLRGMEVVDYEDLDD